MQIKSKHNVVILYFKEFLSRMHGYKVRTFLSILGILTGAAAITGVISVGNLAEQQVLKQFTSLGTNLLSVFVNNSEYGDKINKANLFTEAKAKHIVNIVNNISDITMYAESKSSIIYYKDKKVGVAQTIGVESNIYRLSKLSLKYGRQLMEFDTNSYNIVLGYSIAKKITEGLPSRLLLDKKIRINSNLYTVVGILKKRPYNFFFGGFNDKVLMPIKNVLKNQKNAEINTVIVTLKNNKLLAETKKQITKYISTNAKKHFTYTASPEDFIKSREKSSKTFNLLLIAIGFISLIVGGIGIMNITLATVMERKQEIGIRMAVGAKPSDIQLQFLIESAIISTIGGILGALLGICVSLAVAWFSGWSYVFFALPVIMAIGSSLLTGIFFGYYPARQASKLDPIQALKTN